MYKCNIYGHTPKIYLSDFLNGICSPKYFFVVQKQQICLAQLLILDLLNRWLGEKTHIPQMVV